MDSLEQLKNHYKAVYGDNHVPFCIKRDDGALLLMNNDFQTFSFWKDSQGELWPAGAADRMTYSIERLLVSDSESFTVESWAPLDNLFNNPEKYFQEPTQIKVNYRTKLNNKPMQLEIPVALGELYDKITILTIKTERIKDEGKLKNIRYELTRLEHIAKEYPIEQELFDALKKINESLWGIEDNIRLKEKRKEYDEIFIKLAQSVYINNDERSAIKREINLKYGSDIVEEKSYEDYD